LFTRWGEEMFVSDKNMKDLIFSYLRDKETSISGLSRMLEKDGYKVHRLVLTGYLKALADVGMLKHKEIPPSKVYTVTSNSDKNLYGVVREKCKSLDLEDKEAATIGVYILQNLFRRPIFLQEIRQFGLGETVLAKRVTGDERSEARKKLIKNGFRLPTNDPAYLVDEEKDYEEIMDWILHTILIEEFKAQDLLMGPKQTRLEL
jgi:DNA-binding HxlR family transcriptional regulator